MPVIFVARKIRTYDGHTLAESLLSDSCYVVGEWNHIESALTKQDRPSSWIHEIKCHPRLLLVKNAEEALRAMLFFSIHISTQNDTLLSVTGTNGKTSITEILRQGLERLSRLPTLSVGTLGIRLGTEIYENSYPTMPDFPGFMTAFKFAHQENCHQIVFESTSIGLVENRLGDLKVDVAGFSNFSQDHLDYHKNMNAYKEAKQLLFTRYLKPHGWAIINCDDEEWMHFTNCAKGPQRRIIGVGNPKRVKDFFSYCQKDFQLSAYLSVDQRLANRRGIQVHWTLHQGRTKPLSTSLKCSLIGDFQIDNTSIGAAMLHALGYPLPEIAKQLASIKPIPGRLDLVLPQTQTPAPTVLIDYAHSPDALEKTLLTCRKLKGTAGRLIVVFGCGGDRDRTKRPLMGNIAARLADVCYLTSDNPRTEDPLSILNEIKEGIDLTTQTPLFCEIDRRTSIFQAVSNAHPDDLIVIAGKGHEDYQIIGVHKSPFDDKLIAEQALKALASALLPT